MHRIDLAPSSPVLFYDFFPEFGRLVGKTFTSVCQAKIQAYHNSTNISALDSTGYAAIECLYDSVVSDEVIQINYAGTGVLLGLLPTILSIFGSNTLETALLSTRRPALSFLLALGAPVVTPTRLFDSTDPGEFLELKETKLLELTLPTSSFLRLLLLVIEYALALAAIANVTLIALQLAMMAVSIGVAPVSQRFHWLIWTYIAAAIHLCGLLAFWSRFSYTIDKADRPKKIFPRVWSCIRAEFQLCGQPTIWDVKLRPENPGSFLLSALVSLLIVGHIIYGTTLFSTTQLVLGTDALIIIARYLASAIVCRAVLVFELYGLRATHE